jgi:hypothetical protein
MAFLGFLIIILFVMVLRMGSRTAQLERQMKDVIAAGRGLRIELERVRGVSPTTSTPPPARSIPPIRPPAREPNLVPQPMTAARAPSTTSHTETEAVAAQRLTPATDPTQSREPER